MKLPELTAEERAIYEWQMWVPGFGEEGQRKLKAASVLISRVGGLGGMVAYQLAAAGVGRLVLAHAGSLKPSDLNRQLLQRHDRIGQPRMETIVRRLRELNPRLEIDGRPGPFRLDFDPGHVPWLDRTVRIVFAGEVER